MITGLSWKEVLSQDELAVKQGVSKKTKHALLHAE